jgi:sortase A
MRRTIAGIGRTLVTLGLLILLFVVYQLWGTGIWTARAQEGLEKDFAQAQQQYEKDNPVITTPSTSKPAKPVSFTPAIGQWVGKIKIPKIGLDMIFVEGTDRDELKKGPGHYPGTPMPGTLGNAAIAGHRTTYSHPFGDVDHLNPGDEIIIEMVNGTFTYKVYAPDPNAPTTGHLIVGKRDTYVVNNTPDAQLTLTSCHPKGSAEQRIVIKAKLVANKSAKPTNAQKPKVTPDKTHAEGLEDSLSGQAKSIVPTFEWGALMLAVGLVWWWTFRRWRHPATWLVGVIPFMAVLFVFYVYLERALPAGY